MSLLPHRCLLAGPTGWSLANDPLGGLASGRFLGRAGLWPTIPPGLVLGRQSLRRAAFATSAPPSRRSWWRGWSLPPRADCGGEDGPAGGRRGTREKRAGASRQPTVQRGGEDGPARRPADRWQLRQQRLGRSLPLQAACSKAALQTAALWQDRGATHTTSQEVEELWQAWRPGATGPRGQLTSRSARCRPGAPQKKKRWCGAKWPGCLQGKGGHRFPRHADECQKVDRPGDQSTGQATHLEVGAELTKWKQAPAAGGLLAG